MTKKKMSNLSSNPFIESLDGLIEKVSSSTEKEFLNAYKNAALTFAMPNFLPFDPLNPTQRFADQIIKAFPFTSESWPWPTNATGKYLKPLVQLNLERASAVLKVNLGEGLLQVWLDNLEPTLRLIPLIALDEPLDDFYPEDAPWLIDDFYPEDECMERLIWQFREDLPTPIVKWVSEGTMFPKPSLIYKSWVDETLKLPNNSKKKLFDSIESLGVPIYLPSFFDKRVLLWLGGYPISSSLNIHSSYWPTTPDNAVEKAGKRLLLFLASDDVFALRVSFEEGIEGNMIFKAELSQ